MSILEQFDDQTLIELYENTTGVDYEEEFKKRGYEYGWHKPTTYAGEIYVLVNPAFPNLVKIGYANNVEKRVKSFNRNSGLPDPYHVYATYKVKKRLEDLKLHGLIDSLDSDLRHAKNREFYEMSPEKAYEILSAIAEINGDEDLLVKNPMGDEYFVETVSVKEDEPIKTSRQPRKTGVVPDGIYHMERYIKAWGKTCKAQMRVEDGKYILLSGAICSPIPGGGGPSELNRFIKLRDKGVVVDNVLQEDIECSSPSFAAGFVRFGPTDGWLQWKTEDGQPIDIFRE